MYKESLRRGTQHNTKIGLQHNVIVCAALSTSSLFLAQRKIFDKPI